jgi:DNA-damage-inducible protein D
MMEEDDNTQPTMQSSPFDAIRKVDEHGREYWNAKDLAKLLGYRQYTNFTGAIRKAEIACKESGKAVADHFLHVQEMTPGGKANSPCSFRRRMIRATRWQRSSGHDTCG